jgi:hypothetical protein
MNASSQCSAPESKRLAATSIKLRSVCTSYFITVCDRRLEELSKSIQLWSLGQIAWGKADHSTREYREPYEADALKPKMRPVPVQMM